MKPAILRSLLWAGLLLRVATPLVAQEQSQQRQEPENTLGPWKLANTALFALAFGFLLYRSAPKFFNARSADIQKAIKDATGLKIEADFRYSEMDRKMATLAEEVKRMRDDSAAEMERQHQRVRKETEFEASRIRQNVANEMEALRKEGIREIRIRTAQEALARAEDRLRNRLDQRESDNLVENFVHVIERDTK